MLLSIVIPTYNRQNLLLKTLNGLKSQWSSSMDGMVEIVISDNASPDNTQGVVQEWMEQNKNIPLTYSRNVQNMGFDKNCDIGARAAKGTFVWFMSDDDEIVDDAILYVLNSLKEHSEVVFGFVNYSMLTPGFDEYFPYKYEKNLVLDPDEFMSKSQIGFSFITACIFRRETWCSLDLSKYIGTYWMQLYAAKDAVIHGKSLIIAKPLIKMRREGLQESRRERRTPDRKIDMFMDFHLCFLDYAASFENSKYSHSTYENVMRLGWNDNLGQILSLKLTTDEYKINELKIIFNRMKKYFAGKIIFWTFHVPMLFLPKFCSQFYFFFKMKYIGLKKILRPYLKRDQKNLQVVKS